MVGEVVAVFSIITVLEGKLSVAVSLWESRAAGAQSSERLRRVDKLGVMRAHTSKPS